MHTNAFPPRRGTGIGIRPALLAGSLGLALLPMTVNAQINRSRPPSRPPAQSSGSSSGQSKGADPVTSGSQGNRTPNRRNPVGGSSSYTYSGQRPRNNPASSRGTNPFSNEVHSYTGPGSPFATYRPNQGRASNSQFGPYSGPGSPFMTYKPPKIDRSNYPSGFDRFNQTRESFHYRYRNGLFGRSQPCYYRGWGETFFPGGIAYFPYYYPRYVQGVTVLSPYAFYVDLFPTFISTNVGYYAPPQYVYVPVPTYSNGVYSGWRRDDIDDYYLNREADRLREQEERLRRREQDLDARERDLKEREERSSRQDRDLTIATDNIARAWIDKDIQMLARHVRRDVQIAVYLRGKYQYSLDATDYLDMTRDALVAAKTLSFKLDKVERKEKDVYVVSGRHVYQDKQGEKRTVLVTYVLQKMDNDYIITQIGTAPEKLEE